MAVKASPAMLTVALRPVMLGLAEAASVVVPRPMPLPGVAVIQAGRFVTLHGASSVVASMVIDRRAPSLATSHVDALRVKTLVVPGWVTCTSCPAMVAVVERVAIERLASAVSVTVPEPLPAVGDTVSHNGCAAALAVHGASPMVAATDTVLDPPDEGAFHVVGVTVKVFTPAACVTLMRVVAPPAAICAVADRASADVVAAARSVKLPEPTPVAPPSTVSQGAEVDTVHDTAPLESVTENSCAPPVDAGDQEVGDTSTTGGTGVDT